MQLLWTLPPLGSAVGTVLFCTAAPFNVPEGPSTSCTHPILMTATNGNTEIRLWDTQSHECLQHIVIQSQGAPNLSIASGPDTSHFVISDRNLSFLLVLDLQAPPATLPGAQILGPRDRDRWMGQPWMSWLLWTCSFFLVDLTLLVNRRAVTAVPALRLQASRGTLVAHESRR